MLLAVLAGSPLNAFAQTPASPPSEGQLPVLPPAAAQERHGKVLFQSHGEPPAPPSEAPPQAAARVPGVDGRSGAIPDDTAVPDLTDREREAFTITRYDLNLQLSPAKAGLTGRASLRIRNGGTEALRLLPLQISSTLHWDSAVELLPNAGRLKLPLQQHVLDTDADHTGAAAEAIVTLPEPLAPGRSVDLDVFYSGTLPPSTGRLQRIGITAEQAANVDWDGITAGKGAALRGFGNVLWYPVISPQLFLGSGNELFRAIGAARLQGRGETAKLHIALDYGGEAPVGVYFCGRRQALRAISDTNDAPVAAGRGVAIADFAEAPIGFRTLSLFVVDQPEILTAPSAAGSLAPAAEPAFSSSVSPAGGASSQGERSGRQLGLSGGPAGTAAEPLLAVATTDDAALPSLAALSQRVAPLLVEWFGPHPLSALTILDADGQPFQEGPLVRASIAKLGASTAAGVLVQSLTAAWVQTGEPWMDEGLSEFMSLLWTEQNAGRAAALAQLGESMSAVSLAEPALERPVTPPIGGPASAPAPVPPGETGNLAGQPLITAQNELFYRRKAAAVWWMLREIAGEDPLRQALSAWRLQTASGQDPAAQAVAFRKLLERTSGKDLGWFFEDWVMRDRGLPDLTLVDVTPRQLPAGQGHDSGWLVAVSVRNDGAAVADVPLVVRSGSYSSTKRLRVPGFASVTERVLVEAPPTEVVLNDGSVPEVRNAVHSRTIVTHGP